MDFRMRDLGAFQSGMLKTGSRDCNTDTEARTTAETTQDGVAQGR